MKYLGRWITVYPSIHQIYGLGRTSVLYVESETAKQVVATEVIGGRFKQTINKRSIMQVFDFDEKKILKIRSIAKDIHDRYKNEQRELFEKYLAEMVK